MKPAVFLEEAEEELLTAASYYEHQAAGLGRSFIAEVRRATQFIERFPELAPALRGEVRQKNLRKFPYSVLYLEEQGQLTVVALMHQRRRPDYWTGRIRRQ